MADVFGLDVYVEQQPDAASFGAGKWFISYVIMVNMICYMVLLTLPSLLHSVQVNRLFRGTDCTALYCVVYRVLLYVLSHSLSPSLSPFIRCSASGCALTALCGGGKVCTVRGGLSGGV